MKKRKVDIVVISDAHLGTYGAHAKELNRYLKSIDPEILVLNGDIIDFWAFKKSFWPKEHMQVLKQIVKMLSKGKPIYYLTGNHDDTLRKFTDFKLSNFQLLNKLVLKVDGKRIWLFHGDVFDASINHARWLAKLGGFGYDMLIVFNRFVNVILEGLGRQKYSFSKKIKESVKKAVKFVGDFEKTAMDLAIENGYQYVACGHIHVPSIRNYTNEKGTVTYLNSGDWVENLTSLEYSNGEWSIYEYLKDEKLNKISDELLSEFDEISEEELQIEKELTEILQTLS